jgi:hypothetical protein
MGLVFVFISTSNQAIPARYKENEKSSGSTDKKMGVDASILMMDPKTGATQEGRARVKRPRRQKAKVNRPDQVKKAAKRAKHRRDCIAWNRRNPWYFREARIVKLLFPEDGARDASGSLGGGDERAGMDKVNWPAFRKLRGLNLALAIEEILRRTVPGRPPPGA